MPDRGIGDSPMPVRHIPDPIFRQAPIYLFSTVATLYAGRRWITNSLCRPTCEANVRTRLIASNSSFLNRTWKLP